jgi:hypothetical protein
VSVDDMLLLLFLSWLTSSLALVVSIIVICCVLKRAKAEDGVRGQIETN